MVFDEHMKFEGIEAIVEGLGKVPEQTLIKQFIHSHQADVQGDEATAFAYLDARYGGSGQSLMAAARYDEKYRRTVEGWRITWTYVDVIFSVPVEGLGRSRRRLPCAASRRRPNMLKAWSSMPGASATSFSPMSICRSREFSVDMGCSDRSQNIAHSAETPSL